MTLQQLKYVVTVAECGNITEAAKQLFVSQPTVTSAIHDLEKEMQIVIFIRTNKGVNYQKMVRNSLVMPGRCWSKWISSRVFIRIMW